MTCVTGIGDLSEGQTVLLDDEISKVWAVDGQIWQKKTGSRSIKRKISLEKLSRIMSVRGVLEA
jgi:hypothetical protein